MSLLIINQNFIEHLRLHEWPYIITENQSVILSEDIIITKSYKFFKIIGNGVIFDGNKCTVTILANNYHGLIQSDGFDETLVKNFIISNKLIDRNKHGSLSENAGWLCQNNKNKIIECINNTENNDKENNDKNNLASNTLCNLNETQYVNGWRHLWKP